MRAIYRLAAEYGWPIPSEEAVKRAMGFETQEYVKRIFPDMEQSALDIMGPILDDGELDELKFVDDILFDGCKELLEFLKAAGIRMHIVSTGSKKHVKTILAESGIEKFFDLVSSACSDKREILHEMTMESGVSGTIMVGDMIKDHVAARENGILSVGACYGYCDRHSSGFDLYIDHPLDLLNIFQFKAI